ncbi:MAG: hypothetical protein ABIH83_00945, partial [Candidatus Micrarchaeota archaeon]
NRALAVPKMLSATAGLTDYKEGAAINFLKRLGVKDGNNIITPRDIIWLVHLARDEELTLSRSKNDGIKLSYKALKAAFQTQFSDYKYNQYLCNEFPELKTFFEKFRNTKSKYTKSDLISLIGGETKLSQINESGFLRFIRPELDRSIASMETYEITELYWGALSITRYQSPSQ